MDRSLGSNLAAKASRDVYALSAVSISISVSENYVHGKK